VEKFVISSHKSCSSTTGVDREKANQNEFLEASTNTAEHDVLKLPTVYVTSSILVKQIMRQVTA